MYSVCVKNSARKRICSGSNIWVKDAIHELYVNKKNRGVWATKQEAELMITESWEIVIEEKEDDR